MDDCDQLVFQQISDVKMTVKRFVLCDFSLCTFGTAANISTHIAQDLLQKSSLLTMCGKVNTKCPEMNSTLQSVLYSIAFLVLDSSEKKLSFGEM